MDLLLNVMLDQSLETSSYHLLSWRGNSSKIDDFCCYPLNIATDKCSSQLHYCLYSTYGIVQLD